IDS
ncbi:Thymidine kinase, partial [Monkeypox virus]